MIQLYLKEVGWGGPFPGSPAITICILLALNAPSTVFFLTLTFVVLPVTLRTCSASPRVWGSQNHCRIAQEHSQRAIFVIMLLSGGMRISSKDPHKKRKRRQSHDQERKQPKRKLWAGYPVDVPGSFLQTSQVKIFGQALGTLGKQACGVWTSITRTHGRP